MTVSGAIRLERAHHRPEQVHLDHPLAREPPKAILWAGIGTPEVSVRLDRSGNFFDIFGLSYLRGADSSPQNCFKRLPGPGDGQGGLVLVCGGPFPAL